MGAIVDNGQEGFCIPCLPSDRRSLTNFHSRVIGSGVSSRCKVGTSSLGY